MNSPLVSVGLPTFNRPLLLARALGNLQNQTYKNIEIIVSDDCYPSEDNKKVCDEFTLQGLRIKYHRPEKNLGGPNNHKRVLDLASGKYFFWASDDDQWDKNFISAGVLALETNTHIGGWSPSFVNTDVNGSITRTYPALSRFSSTSFKTFDLAKYLIEPESLGKCVLVHGIYLTQPLKDFANIYFWNRGKPWMDNSFMYGLITRINILCTSDVMLYKTIIDSDNSSRSIDVKPYEMTWKDHAGPNMRDYAHFTHEHALAAKNYSHAILAWIMFALRFIIDIGFRVFKKLKTLRRNISIPV